MKKLDLNGKMISTDKNIEKITKKTKKNEIIEIKISIKTNEKTRNDDRTVPPIKLPLVVPSSESGPPFVIFFKNIYFIVLSCIPTIKVTKEIKTMKMKMTDHCVSGLRPQ